MLPINFDTLQADYPEYALAWEALRQWFSRHARKRYIELTVLAKDLPQVEKIDLALALRLMVDLEMLCSAYRVKAPGGYLLEGDFSDLGEIPAHLPDRDRSRSIRTDQGDIVAGYRWGSADAA